MPVLDFVRRERLVRVAGRSFRVGPPTVATVLLFCALLAERALALAQAIADDKIPDGTDLGDLVDVFLAVPECAEVLESCVRDEQGHPAVGLAELDRAALKTLVLASLRLCDVERIASMLGFGGALSQARASERPLDFGFDVGAHGLVSAARALGVTPLALTEWPYEALLSAQDALAVTPDQVKASRAAPLSGDTGIPGLEVL